jgi:hypothetical protein
MTPEQTLIVLGTIVFLYLVFTMRDATPEDDGAVIAVMSRTCGHCRRAWRDIEGIQAERNFVVYEPSSVDGELEAELRGAGYSGSVPFFYNRKSRRSIEGYRPASEILSSLL